MPRSKRDKKVSLTKTKKKGLNFKQKLVEDIRTNIERFERLFVFSVENMRNAHLKDVRALMKSSRFFFGKSKVMALALGRTEDSEAKKNLRFISDLVKGQRGLLFTNEPQEKIISFFETHVEPEFARSGFKATRTVTLKQGPVLDFKSSMEPELRKLGLPVEVKLGKTELRRNHIVCKEGDILNPSQAQILKLIGESMAEFRVTLVSVWNKDGTYEILQKEEVGSNDIQEEPIEDDQEDDDDDEEMHSDGGEKDG